MGCAPALKVSRAILGLTLVLALGGCPGDDRGTEGDAPAPVPAAGIAASPSTSTFEAPRVTPDEVRARQAAGEDLMLVDVRSAESFKHEHITGAESFPWATLEKSQTKLPRERRIVLYCA